MMRAHTDWLHHRLAVTGPPDEMSKFRASAVGAGSIPWRLDLERMEEEWFHLLMFPREPQRRTLSASGARILAGQLRDAVLRRHTLAAARVGHSRACPFDLHALIPVPDAVLSLGPDDPASIEWLWSHWGTTQPLRQVAEDGAGGFVFWSADWTPWRALARLAELFPALRLDARPTYATT